MAPRTRGRAAAAAAPRPRPRPRAYDIFAATESAAAAESVKATAALVDPDARVQFATVDPIEFVHTAVDTHTFEDRLPPLTDWWLLGEADFLVSCGTTYSQTALGRRRRLPDAFVTHQHFPYKSAPTGNATRPCTCADPGLPHACPRLVLSSNGVADRLRALRLTTEGAKS